MFQLIGSATADVAVTKAKVMANEMNFMILFPLLRALRKSDALEKQLFGLSLNTQIFEHLHVKKGVLSY